MALDIGTSSVRAGLYDSTAEVLPETMVKNERIVRITSDGGAEIDANEAFEQVKQVIDDVINRCPAEVEPPKFAAASCFWHSLLGIDANGTPTTPVFTWAETRPARFVRTLRDELNETETHNRTGCRFHSSYWPAKLLWLRSTQNETFEKTARWLSFSDYAALKLFGEAQTSVSMASGTGIFDIRQNVWDSELLEFLNISTENLPPIIEKDEKTFKLTANYTNRWKRLSETAWFPAIGDGAANNIGANCLKKQKAALMIGTSGAMRVAFAGDVPRKIPSGLWCYRIDRKRLIIGGALSDGGGLYYWLKHNFRLKKNDDKTERKIKKRAADGHGLTFLPFLAGERSTGYHEDATGALLGLKSAHDKIDIVQAALEAVAYRFAEIYDQLNEVLEIEEIIASGGALRESPVWTQIICDTLAQNMNLPDTREASSRGAVLLASETAGQIENIAELRSPEGQRFAFNPENHEIYKRARSRHEKFYRMLVDEEGQNRER